MILAAINVADLTITGHAGARALDVVYRPLLAQGASSERDAFATLPAAARQADRPVEDVA